MNESILIVDDDPAILSGFDDVLTEIGFSIGKASDEKETLRMLNEKEYNVAIVDIVLKETNGINLIKKICDNYKKLVVIALTGYPNAENAIGSYYKGAFEFLEKPCSCSNLIDAISRGLANKRNKLENEVKQHYFPWDKIIRDNPSSIDTVLGHAIRKVKKEVFCKVKKCEESFQCLCSKNPKICAGESYIGKECCFINKETKKECHNNNQISFGNGYVCLCPIRCELFRNNE